ncbi:hypothetical protein CONLIGDRAFT_279815 [Coniochaeta ligniaria NRRL 30616]|uniref:Uncharacterized protein n=1 Tax=Coniochaeta ligniaria NRRL 30616 TaxID=1408157 RepID=A0A1J7JRR9_9PEZI|nr:hypothetical protein CONLIGDRAFT_279815 [Coniochaeta ligniaria NRRL 30616]
MHSSGSEARNPDAMHITQRDMPESLVSDLEMPIEGSHTFSPDQPTDSPDDPREGSSGAQGEAAGFRLTLLGMRGELNQDSDDDECTSQSSTNSSTGTPPESPAQSLGVATEEGLQASHLDVDRNSVNISHRSSLDVRISFTAGPEPDEAGAAEEEPPDGSPMDPWMRFLYDEIESTESSGEHHTYFMLLVLADYFACQEAKAAPARRAADVLHQLNDEYLLCASSWEIFEYYQDLQGFLWLVWGALLDVVVRMDYRDDSQDSVVLLVEELLRPRPTRNIEITGVCPLDKTLDVNPLMLHNNPNLFAERGTNMGRQ